MDTTFNPADGVAKIRAAQALLVQRGWAKLYWEDEKGRICKGMALLLSYGHDEDDLRYSEALKGLPVTPYILAAIERATGVSHASIVDFNQASDTDEELVMYVLDRTAEDLKTLALAKAIEIPSELTPDEPHETTFAQMLARHGTHAKVLASAAIVAVTAGLTWLRNFGIV